MKKQKYLYAGMDSDTPIILSQSETLELSAVALNESFFVKTANPFNLLFKGIYFLRRKELLSLLESLLLSIWKVCGHFSSSVFRRNRELLIFLSEKKVKIIPLEDIDFSEKFLKNLGVTFIVVNIYGILSERLLNIPKFGVFNIHPSKLPQYRGALPTLWSLKNRDTSTALSYIILNNRVDSGKIVAQHEILIGADDNVLDLEHKLKKVLKETLVSDVEKYLRGEVILQKQDESIASKTGLYEKYREIKWGEEMGIDIYNKILLYPYLYPTDYCYFSFKEKKIFVRKADYFSDEDTDLRGPKGKNIWILKGSVFFQMKKEIIRMKFFRDLSIQDSLRFLFWWVFFIKYKKLETDIFLK